MDNKRECRNCKKMFDRQDMRFTYDCHGIVFRLVCDECFDALMEKGYDGEYYTEADENIDYY